MKYFAVAGWSGSGKTTLITKLVEYFKSKNKRVIAVKNIPHHYHLQPETKDSHKFLTAGCDEVFLLSKQDIVAIQRNDTENKIFSLLENKYSHSDIILLEGLSGPGIPVIEVFDSKKNEAPKFPIKNLAALISDNKDIGGEAAPVFDFDDIDGVIKFMEDYYG
ncbi:MAG: molybdopterin-guanine dinucleotide biosynthesis protein B [Candidatus Aminicenantes bacterium]|nr:molybdopterin-guanine dinucleotide biosynthesis protein B [Candidatus Aminicenantes bacterium]